MELDSTTEADDPWLALRFACAESLILRGRQMLAGIGKINAWGALSSEVLLCV